MTQLLRIIGDIHGDLAAFDTALDMAPGFIIQLGDLVDRGPDSAGCLRRALDLCESGRGVVLRGNHDDKLARLLRGNPIKVPADLQRTRDQIKAAPDADALIHRFLTAWEAAPWWLLRERFLFVHGAFHPEMLIARQPEEIATRSVRDKAKWLALYGEGRMGGGETLPQRTYGWVETIPEGLTVVVGHDVRSETAPMRVQNADGGVAIFLDTGCGKGGRLSWIDTDADGGIHFGFAPA